MCLEQLVKTVQLFTFSSSPEKSLYCISKGKKKSWQVLLKGWGSNADFLLSLPQPCPLPYQHWERICGQWVHAKEPRTVPAVLGLQAGRKKTIYILTAVVTWEKKIFREYLGSDPKSIEVSGNVCVSHGGAAWEGCLMYSWCHIPWGVCCVLFGYSLCMLYLCGDSSGIICEEKLLFRALQVMCPCQ